MVELMALFFPPLFPLYEIEKTMAEKLNLFTQQVDSLNHKPEHHTSPPSVNTERDKNYNRIIKMELIKI